MARLDRGTDAMPDLKLAPLLDAVESDELKQAIRPLFHEHAGEPVLEFSHLDAPRCLWAVFRQGGERVTFKSFFSEDAYAEYAKQLADALPDFEENGVLLLPSLNAMLWRFPFDPAMPFLARCMDDRWIGSVLGRRAPRGVVSEPVDYRPEMTGLFAYRDPLTKKILAYGKCAPADRCGVIYLVMDRLWHSPARRSGRLRLAQPLAFRPEAGLLLQAPVPGRPAAAERNDERFLDLVRAAASALAALQATRIPIGREVSLENVLAAFAAAIPDLSFTFPELYATAHRLLDRAQARAGRCTAELVTSHGDFKWDQFLINRGRYALIDFEACCLAEPSLDPGSFCAYLPPSTANDWRDSAAAELERSVFLSTYEQISGRPIDFDRLSLYESVALARRAIAHKWTQGAGWQLRASSLLDLAFERLQNPQPAPQERR